MLPSGLAMLVLSLIAAKLIVVRGAPQTLALGAGVVALGWVSGIVFTGSLRQVVVGATVLGIGTGIGCAAIPTLVNQHTLAADTVVLGDVAGRADDPHHPRKTSA